MVTPEGAEIIHFEPKEAKEKRLQELLRGQSEQPDGFESQELSGMGESTDKKKK